MPRLPERARAREGEDEDEDDEYKAVGEGEEESSDDDDDDDDAMDADRGDGEAREARRKRPEVWRPGSAEDEDVELEYDESAYDALHAFSHEWPCLSLDVMRDDLGEGREVFPHEMTIVTGTQAMEATKNVLSVIRVSRIKKTRRDADADEDMEASDSDDDEDGGSDAPTLTVASVVHHGCVNRVRAMPQRPSTCASWSDSGHVMIWDLSAQLKKVMTSTNDSKGKIDPPSRVTPTQVFTGHKDEGYALDWSSVCEGRLASGDCAGAIHTWDMVQGKWDVGATPYTGHYSSVEDIQWSPTERDVFISCSADQTVCVWDTRQRAKPALRVKTHDSDVNVLSWNRLANSMVATGADDGSLRIWDLRNFNETNAQFVANFTFHRAAVTSVDWAPFDSAMLASSSADNTVCVWDLAVERDAEEEAAALAAKDNAAPPEDLPPQLMFVHQGLKDPKEIKWHRQIPGACVTTAADGFNIFKAYNVGPAVP